MQVKVLPDAMAVLPAFGQVDPALTAAFTGDSGVSVKQKIAEREIDFLITKFLRLLCNFNSVKRVARNYFDCNSIY